MKTSSGPQIIWGTNVDGSPRDISKYLFGNATRILAPKGTAPQQSDLLTIADQIAGSSRYGRTLSNVHEFDTSDIGGHFLILERRGMGIRKEGNGYQMKHGFLRKRLVRVTDVSRHSRGIGVSYETLWPRSSYGAEVFFNETLWDHVDPDGLYPLILRYEGELPANEPCCYYEQISRQFRKLEVLIKVWAMANCHDFTRNRWYAFIRLFDYWTEGYDHQYYNVFKHRLVGQQLMQFLLSGSIKGITLIYPDAKGQGCDLMTPLISNLAIEAFADLGQTYALHIIKNLLTKFDRHQLMLAYKEDPKASLYEEQNAWLFDLVTGQVGTFEQEARQAIWLPLKPA